jgi:hypothetical protein
MSVNVAKPILISVLFFPQCRGYVSLSHGASGRDRACCVPTAVHKPPNLPTPIFSICCNKRTGGSNKTTLIFMFAKRKTTTKKHKLLALPLSRITHLCVIYVGKHPPFTTRFFISGTTSYPFTL